MKVKLWCWRCECCGFEWIMKFGFPKLKGRANPIVPAQCPSSHCRSREWNGKKKAGRPPLKKEAA